jgi:hypothetical protein
MLFRVYVQGMVQKDRNIKVIGERREQIDIQRIADLLVRVARQRALERGADVSDLWGPEADLREVDPA